MIRSSGVLMPIYSLPGDYGIGGFGPEAIQFASKLRDAGFSYWLVLPFNERGDANSPYSSISAYAGNPAYLNLHDLLARGLITDEELNQGIWKGDPHHIDYGWLNRTREQLLRAAYSRIGINDSLLLADFVEQNKGWLTDYALFCCIRNDYDNAHWWTWPDLALRRHDPAALHAYYEKNQSEVMYYCFVQFEFFRQWHKIKAQINDLGIRIIGDLPIYVSDDSADVWADRHFFEINEEDRFERVAGVPPDYFSEDGQLWGNPLYRWDVMAKDNYGWWIRRLRQALQIYDLLRLDHFRGFDSYWAVPADQTTAIHGTWLRGPGMDLFNVLLREFPAAAIIAEDLGEITNDVRLLLKQTGLPGMKVLQFAFNPYLTDATDRPHNYVRHSVAFSGTHDNPPLLGWLAEVETEEWELVRDYFGLKDADRTTGGVNSPACRTMVRTLMQSIADLVIVPVQDLLGLDATYRINTPGTVVNNWQIRFTQEQLAKLDLAWLLRLNQVTQRI